MASSSIGQSEFPLVIARRCKTVLGGGILAAVGSPLYTLALIRFLDWYGLCIFDADHKNTGCDGSIFHCMCWSCTGTLNSPCSLSMIALVLELMLVLEC